MSDLYRQHITRLCRMYEETFELLRPHRIEIDSVLIHSGLEAHFYGDDQAVPFRAFGHFRHWVPVNRPEQMILVRRGAAPIFFQVTPGDFWYDQSIPLEDWWGECFDLVQLERAERISEHLSPYGRIAFLGEAEDFAGKLGMPKALINEPNLLNRLSWIRSIKDDYEIKRIREASQVSAAMHNAAKAAFDAGGSEWEIYRAMLESADEAETDLPYAAIVAENEKAAVLHYQHKQRTAYSGDRLVLIDAGLAVSGYAADITRSYTQGRAHSVIAALPERIGALKDSVLSEAKIGVPNLELQQLALDGVADILLEFDLARGSREALQEAGIPGLFMPHGIGHLLGLQVHDVGGLFKKETGVLEPPPEEHRHLRLNRTLESGMVFTIEPGLYFIPLLLEPERACERGRMLNWSLIEELIPWGGVRMEDNVWVTEAGPVNLTAEAYAAL